MALTAAQIQDHTSKWENYYSGKPYPHRRRWPGKLFHHCPIENAVSILNDGNIRSRNDTTNLRELDVAGSQVIESTDAAHSSSRFYFRPRTPTQFYIEGIRKPADCVKFGPTAHAPILIMFILKATNILQLPGTKFSKKNMQIVGTETGDTVEFFNEIPFEKVFHEGGIDGDYSIIEHRCAEVLANSPVSLSESLECVCCRSVTERDTLLHLLGVNSDRWRDKILVSDDLRVFDKKFAFLQNVQITKSGLLLSINRRSDGQNVKLEAVVTDANNHQVLTYFNDSVPCTPPSGTQWNLPHEFIAGQYEILVKIDDHRAAHFVTEFGDSLF